MPNIQTSYLSTLRPGFAGMLANEEGKKPISRNVEDASGIGFGKAVKQGTADKGCTATLTGLDAYNFIGITLAARDTSADDPDKYSQYRSALILEDGCIWVATDAAVAAGTDVTVNTTTGGFSSATPGAGQVLIPNARWETSTASAGLAVLRLRG